MKYFALLFALLPLTGQAAYYVEEDMPAPVATQMAVAQARPQPTPAFTYAVPFQAKKYTLGRQGLQSIKNIASELRKSRKIIVQGRPDGDNPENSDLARRRGLTIKKLLLQYGVAAPRIELAEQREANYADDPDVFNSTIVTADALPPASAGIPTAYYPRAQPSNPNSTSTAIVAPQQPAPAARPQHVQQSDAVPLSSVKRILKIAGDAKLNTADSMKLLESVLMTEGNPQQNQISTAPIAAPVTAPPPMFIPAAATARKPAWKLDSAKTLKDNITDWTVIAGWNPPLWQASNFYQVTVTTSLEGDFPDVLRQIADSTGLNICAKKYDRYVRVTDANVSCKD